VARFSRVIALDLPGYGRAEHPHRFDFTVEGYARFLDAVLKQHGVERAHLVLHDFGGGFGLRWAADHPQQFASATLINTGILPGYRWHRFARIWQTPILGELFQLPSSAKFLKRALDMDNPRPLPLAFAQRITDYADWNHKRAVLELYRNSRDPEATFNGAIPALSALDRPACVIWGAGDPYLPVKYAELQRQAFPRAEVHVLEGLGHWPFIDDPAAVTKLVTDFLRRQVGTSIAARSHGTSP
jgi:pimeloyl-ACP methyl ester carboxylesterase